jgi:hypothetical protein
LVVAWPLEGLVRSVGFVKIQDSLGIRISKSLGVFSGNGPLASLAEGWGAADKFTVVLETAAFNATELSAYCRERGLYPEQVSHWRQVAQNANAKPVRSMAEQKDLEKLHAQDQREIKALKKELQRKEKALAEAAALLVLRKKWEAFCSEDEEG